MEVDEVLGALTKVGRIARMICLERGIVRLLVRRRPSDVDDRQNSQGQIQCIGVKVTSTLAYAILCPVPSNDKEPGMKLLSLIIGIRWIRRLFTKPFLAQRTFVPDSKVLETSNTSQWKSVRL